MLNGKAVKIISVLATLVGTGATLVTDWTNQRKLDAKIIEKSNEAVERILKEKGLI